MTKEEFEFRKKQVYMVSEEDAMKATAKMMSEDGNMVSEMLKEQPALALLVPVIGIELWNAIVEMKQEEAQDTVNDIMASILASDKEDK
jgi:hypothetical protein